MVPPLGRPHRPARKFFADVVEQIDEHQLEQYDQARGVIGGIINHYDHHRLHAALNYVRPVDYYRPDPAALLAERHRKLARARALRKQENLKLRQRRLPWPEAKTVAYSKRQFVSL